MSNWLYKLTAYGLFLVALFILMAFLGSIRSLSLASYILIPLSLAIISSAGIFFLKTKQKNKLLRISAWLIISPITIMLLITAVLMAIFGLTGPPNSKYVSIWFALISLLLGISVISGLISLLIHLIRKSRNPKNKQ